MRTRAYRPEVTGCLEARSLLSGVAGPPAHPVILPNRRLTLVIEHTRLAFEVYGKDRKPSNFYLDEHLREQIYNVAVIIPYGRVDGLGVEINEIVDRMLEEIAAGAPRPIRSAAREATAAIRADVLARVRAGDVIVR